MNLPMSRSDCLRPKFCKLRQKLLQWGRAIINPPSYFFRCSVVPVRVMSLRIIFTVSMQLRTKKCHEIPHNLIDRAIQQSAPSSYGRYVYQWNYSARIVFWEQDNEIVTLVPDFCRFLADVEI